MRKSLIAVSAFALGCAVTAWLGGRADAAPGGSADAVGRLELFGEVLAVVEAKYAGAVDASALVEAGVKGMVRSLDGRSDYITASEFAALWDKAKANAAREAAAGPDSAASAASAASGSGVSAEGLGGGVGRVRVARFGDGAARAVEAAIAELRARDPGLAGVVLDLRGNQGGLVKEVVATADLFLEDGDILTVRGRGAEEVERRYARPGGVGALALVVLIDGGTAMGAEMLAQALQDRGRARLVGSRSYGEASVQTVTPLDGGRRGAVKLTTARWTGPSGRSVQGVGLTPDVAVDAAAGEAAALARAVEVVRG